MQPVNLALNINDHLNTVDRKTNTVPQQKVSEMNGCVFTFVSYLYVSKDLSWKKDRFDNLLTHMKTNIY